MRKAMLGLSAVLCLLFVGTAHADLIYDLTLTHTTGCVCDGTGSFEITTAPLTGTNQQSTYHQGSSLVALSFSIGGDTFDLSDSTGAFLQFTSGSLSDITYNGTYKEKVGNQTITISFQQNGLQYQFQDTSKNENSTGVITLSSPTPHVAATPEPSSFILLGTSLFAGAGVFRRRLLA